MISKFSWNSIDGRGFFPVKENPYNQNYFNKCHSYEDTEIGKKLNDFRINLVNKYVEGVVLDVGIGSGTFIKHRGNCFGYDVNPAGIDWLNEKNLMLSPYQDNLCVDGITFFDSLEHIEDTDKILNNIKNQIVFVSIPIFKDKNDVLKSKHYREDEHYHYFTEKGFISYINNMGFRLLEKSTGESECGRDNITTFVFKRKKVIINQFNKIGDILFSMYYFQELARNGYEVIIPVFPFILELQKNFPEVKFIDKDGIDINYNNKEIVETNDAIIVPLRYSNNKLGGSRNSAMQSKYILLEKIFKFGIKWEDWKKMKITRTNNEDKLFNEIGLCGKKYTLVNEHYALGVKKLDISGEVVNMKKIAGYNLIDWLKVIENAEVIHTVATSNLFLLQYATTKDINIYKRPSEPNINNIKEISEGYKLHEE